MPICIEHVDDVRADAYTIELFRDEDGTPRGRVVPPTHRAARQPRSISSEVSPDQAIEIAVRLARRDRATVVVWDPDGLWPADWGELIQA
jgi:hypothetical protein